MVVNPVLQDFLHGLIGFVLGWLVKYCKNKVQDKE